MHEPRIMRLARATTIGSACFVLFMTSAGCSADEPSSTEQASAGAGGLAQAPEAATEASPTQRGKLIVHFTVHDRKERDDCAELGVKEIALTITTPRAGELGQRRELGAPQGTWRHQCEAFAVSLSLEPGTYDGSAVLLDHVRGPRTTPVLLDRFEVRPNATVETSIGFPANAFLGR